MNTHHEDWPPDQLFDSHVHIYRCSDYPGMQNTLGAEVPPAVWRARLEPLLGPGRLKGGLFMPHVKADAKIDSANDWLLQQLPEEPDSRGLLLVTPESDPEDRRFREPRIAGFKPYHLFSPLKPTWQAPIEAFLPEWVWALAEERQAVIMLHLVRDAAFADPDNQRYILEHTERYPHARLVLAHAARGFNYHTTQRGIPALRRCHNLWFDTSGICEAPALTALLDAFGPRRLLWGTDFPVSEMRGRCVAVGETFLWITMDILQKDKLATPCEPATVGHESLRALQQAVADFGLNAADLRDVFHDNAQRLLGLLPESSAATEEAYRQAKTMMPGGTQLLSKRPEMFAPGQWPAYFREARGCETWDLDGRHYYDFSSSGIGSCLLGFRDPEVTRAVRRRLNLGVMCTLNPPEELELAQTLLRLHPWAEAVRFARGGGEIAAVAVRIARATTRREKVAVCGYHGWHDWYLAANLGSGEALDGHLLPGLEPLGVPAALRGTTLPFHYNNLDALETIITDHGDQLAAIVMEPCRYQPPAPGFLEGIRNAAQRCGALLIFDEITIGWRLELGGAHLRFGGEPDMAIFAKTLGNGHPIAALLGTQQAMAGAHGSFISSTYWTESIGPAAALATLERMQALPVRRHIEELGHRILELWRDAGAAHEVPVRPSDGFPCIARLQFEHEEEAALRTLYTQEMLREGFLANTAVMPTWAHGPEELALFSSAVDRVFARLAQALRAGRISESLRGPVAHSGFRRLN